ncbi:MAG TPA: hypothetical protein VMA83_03590 [Solirubrobacteraceae bacterium]|nr:hypothetical protein [Solirubrobacteraceae bacterium]
MRKAFATLGVLAAAAITGMALFTGVAAAKTKPPAIKSVSFKGTPAEPLIVVKGIGLGSLPVEDAEETPNCFGEEPSGLGNDFGSAANIEDSTAGWQAGLGPGDCIGLTFKTYTETEVAFTVGSAYREYAEIHTGDSYTVNLRGLTKSGTVKIKEKKKK